MKENQSWRGFLLIFIAGLLWGTIGVFVKEMSLAGADALSISFIRVLLAFLVMLVVTLMRKGLSGFRIPKKELLYCALLGIVCQGIYNIFYSYAVTLSGVSVSAVLLCIAPVFTTIVSVRLFREKLNGWKILAIGINILGCTMTATGGQFSVETLSVIGILCGIGAGISYAMTAIFGRLTTDSTDVFVSSTYSYLFAALLLFIPGRPWRWNGDMHMARILFMGLLLAVIPTAFAYILYYKGIAMIRETSKVPVVASGETVVAAILGVSLYAEKVNAVSLLGICLVMASILFMSIRKKTEIKK